MAEDGSEQRAWAYLERGPTQNAAYVIGGTFVLAWVIGAIGRAFKGLPFDMALLKFIGKSALAVGAFTALLTTYLKSWKVKYNESVIVESRFVFIKTTVSSYHVPELQRITCYFSRSVTMFGLPFDTLIFEFRGSTLALRTSDWTRESLKQFIRDLMSYRNDVPVDPLLLNYIAGQYDDVFVTAAERSSGYADPSDF